MVKNESSGQSPEPPGIRQRLKALRDALLHLHKALLESERVGYEATFGQISSPYQFLHLVTSDPWFAWLAPITQLIAAVDETLEAPEPLTAAVVEAIVNRSATLLVAAAGAEGFAGHYDDALQRSPDVVMAHAAAARIIRAKD